MLTILLYILAYIVASYTLMAVPCLIWGDYEQELYFVPAAFFITAPVSWPLFVLVWIIAGGEWLCDLVTEWWRK